MFKPRDQIQQQQKKELEETMDRHLKTCSRRV